MHLQILDTAILNSPMATTVLSVGILGLTPATEPIYVGVLSSLTTCYTLAIVHTDNKDLVYTSSWKEPSTPLRITMVPDDVIKDSNVNLIINLLPFRQNEIYTIAALRAGKHVMVRTPLSLSTHSLDQIRHACKEQHSTASESKGPRPQFFISCARRYAPCFTDIFQKELARLEKIHYVRCRNITGSHPTMSNSLHQSGNTVSTTDINTDGPPNNSSHRESSLVHRPLPPRMHALLADIFGPNVESTADREALCHFIGTSGSHDFSLIQECLGFPDAVSHVSIIKPFYNAMFHYKGGSAPGGANAPYTLFYEAGVDGVPRSDAHLTVYGLNKTITFSYELDSLTPGKMGDSAVARVIVEEFEVEAEAGDRKKQHLLNEAQMMNGRAHGDGDSRLKRTEYVNTAREVYEQEFLAVHAQLTAHIRADTQAHPNARAQNGSDNTKVRAKTSVDDALDDLKMMHMIFDHYDRQCGTIRTPLG